MLVDFLISKDYTSFSIEVFIADNFLRILVVSQTNDSTKAFYSFYVPTVFPVSCFSALVPI